jgi:hypothetical protein
MIEYRPSKMYLEFLHDAITAGYKPNEIEKKLLDEWWSKRKVLS